MDWCGFFFGVSSIDVELRNELGKGEFGIVYEVIALHGSLEEGSQGESMENLDDLATGTQQQKSTTTTHPTPAIELPSPISRPTREKNQHKQPSVSIVQEDNVTDNTVPFTSASRVGGGLHRRQRSKDSAPRNGGGDSSNSSARDRIVSFAEDYKLPEGADEDSTLSTDSDLDDDLSQLLAAQTEGDEDDSAPHEGEVEVIRNYMAKHCLRNGQPRYAVKKIRPDLHDASHIEAAIIDLAKEAKFLASIRHPNIVKIRGTVGTPGTYEFMIIMDCLQLTLRQKVEWWQQQHIQSHGPRGIFAFLPNASKQACLEDVFADKLLALYDIARAMRYLHNHS